VNTFISVIFLSALAAMVVVAPMYFFDLSLFGKVMVRDHGDLVGRHRLSLSDAYGYLRKIRGGQLGEVPLSPDAKLAHARATKFLYVAMSLFMMVLLIGLADAMLSKHGGGM